MNQKINTQDNKQTTFQEDNNAMNQAANEMVQAFGRDTYIGQSYSKLAEAAEKANTAFERLLKFGEERQR